MDRVVFYSARDASWVFQLKIAQSIIEKFSSGKAYNCINDVLELFHIKQYIDDSIFLPEWSEEFIQDIKVKAKHFNTIVREYFSCLDQKDIIEEIRNVDFIYLDSFWELFANSKLYNKIKPEKFLEILQIDEHIIRNVLAIKELTKIYGEVIRIYMLNNSSVAELLLEKYEMADSLSKMELNFPSCLSNEDKETIILNYLSSDNPNPNFVKLIVNSGTTDNFKISDLTRYKAIELDNLLCQRFLSEGHITEFGCGVTISPDQIDPVKYSFVDNKQYFSYSESLMKILSMENGLYWIFVKLFDYLDDFGRITLVSKSSELDIFDKILIHGKKEYRTGVIFKQKNNLSYIQLVSYDHFLSQNDSRVESLIFDFFDKFVKDKFGITGFIFRPTSSSSSYLEKIRMLAGEFDSLLKQYSSYVHDGIINHNYLNTVGKPIYFKDIPSMVKKKYFVGKGDLFNRLLYLFFSDQSPLNVKIPGKKKYKNLIDFLLHEKLNYESLYSFQKTNIDYLISLGYLQCDSNGIVLVSKIEEVEILRDLYRNDVSCFWRYNSNCQSLIDDMENRGLISYYSSLFSKPEIEFINYVMNKKMFMNGLNIRNSYIHGFSDRTEDLNKNNYYHILRMLTLLTLKIMDDLFLNFYISSYQECRTK